LIGVADSGASVRAEANPGAVYVRRGDTPTNRWPLVPPWPAPGGLVAAGARPDVFFLGDSVMLGARDAILSSLRGWDVTLDAKISRTTFEGLSIVQARRSQIRTAAVIQLGENESVGSGYASRVAAMMRALKDTDLVVWLTVGEVDANAVAIDRTLRRTLAPYRNAIVADWNAVAPPDGLAGDGLHLNVVGAKAMANLVKSYLRPWLATAEANADTPCRSAIDQALAASG
jgi:lysophospholipase L1-like esterase